MAFTKLVVSNNDMEPVGDLPTQVNIINAAKINWTSYFHGHIISTDHHQFIMKYDHAADASERDAIIKENPENCIRVFVNLLNKISTEQTTQYLLTLIDNMLQEDKQRVEMFHDYFIKIQDSMMDNFFCFLRRDNNFIVHQASRIIAKLACWSSQLMENKDLQYFMLWTLEQLEIKDNINMHTLARNLQMILRMRKYRLIFVRIDGIESLVRTLSGKLNSQIQYQLIFCLWCLSFDADIVQQMVRTPNLITVISDIILQTEREKIIRISFAYFRFLIEKLNSATNIREVALAMVHCKILKHLELLQQRDFSHDPELTDDLTFLMEKLSANVQDVSSLEEYTIELKTGRLEWSPVHKAAKFWRENAENFLEKNYELLKMLKHLLQNSKDSVTLQVAIHDIGEFVRHYPRGKHVIEKLGCKDIVMEFLSSNDANLRYYALITLQKIMVHNWEYLGLRVD